MRFVEREFHTREQKCIYTTWPGHEGRSGVRWVDGKKQIVPGEGVGSNYWDLLPFGGEDALATVYYYDTLRRPGATSKKRSPRTRSGTSPPTEAYDPADLRQHAAEVKDVLRQALLEQETGRFGTVDLDGQMHDYGFTFLNNEAVTFGIATPEQARIDPRLDERQADRGRRHVDRRRHLSLAVRARGPRRCRNIDYYFWGWSNPEDVPWGGQVQDGGAVLGWSLLRSDGAAQGAGPDAVAAATGRNRRSGSTTRKREGGYRAYYGKDPARGTMQGGGTAGGLGLDKEFFESVMARR